MRFDESYDDEYYEHESSFEEDEEYDTPGKANKKSWTSFFFVTFIATLVFICMMFLLFSPRVDVQIGGEEQTAEKENFEEDTYRSNVDHRLQWIQMEDNEEEPKQEDGFLGKFKVVDAKDSSESVPSTENDEKPVENSDYYKNENATNQQKKNDNTKENIAESAIYLPDLEMAHTATKTTLSKVYIGSYQDINKAIEVQNKLAESNLQISPFIKQKDGLYYIQAGSFASAAKAESLVQQLAQIGLSAKVVEE